MILEAILVLSTFKNIKKIWALKCFKFDEAKKKPFDGR